MTRHFALAFTLSACLLAPPSIAGAQTPAPREIPKDFVLPGPAPKNAPAPQSPAPAAPAATQPPAPVAAPGLTGAMQDPASPAAITGAMATMPQGLLPTAGTTQILRGSTHGDSGAANVWPCMQRRLERVDTAQVWQGPPLETADPVERTDAMRQLVATVKARRVPLPEAETTIAEFIKNQPESSRATIATAVFADLLSELNKERSDIMRGIERYGAKQQTLADKIRRENTDLSTLRLDPDADQAKRQAAEENILWDTRIFNERRGSLTYVCEVPTLIEQRLFALGRAIGRGL